MKNKIVYIGKWLLLMLFIGLFLKFIDSSLGGVFPVFKSGVTVKVKSKKTIKIEKVIDSSKIEGKLLPKSNPIKVAISEDGSIRKVEKSSRKDIKQKKAKGYRVLEKGPVKYNVKEVTQKLEKERIVAAKETKGSIKLKNSTLEYSIISNANNGDILSFKALVETDLTTITTDTNTTKTRSRSSLFLNVEPLFSFDKKIIGGEVSIDFTSRNKIRIGGGYGYNNLIPLDKGYFKLKIGFRLW